ncbi:MAG: class I SAM-dependent methyltransferase [Cellulosilyticaceae bacterium]
MDVVRDYYDSFAEGEWQRLNKPYSNVEFRSTLYLIDKYFPKEGKVLDIGAGPGRYSLELLKRGYSVSLLDLSQKELDIAKGKITDAGYTAEKYWCRSALELGCFEDDTFDAILLMGPMYHLHDAADREKVLGEARRILKPNGVAVVTYINTWGALKASLREFPESFADVEHFERYQKGGLIFSEEESFTATYFATPVLALAEVEKVGYEVISYAGAESFIAGMRMEIENLAIYMPEVYENYVSKAAEYCELPQYRDATEHLNVVVRG